MSLFIRLSTAQVGRDLKYLPPAIPQGDRRLAGFVDRRKEYIDEEKKEEELLLLYSGHNPSLLWRQVWGCTWGVAQESVSV